MAIYAFDGTACTPSDLSNVFRMYDAYDSRHKFYATGPGTRGTWFSKLIEAITGHGGKDRVNDAFEIWKYWQFRGSRETIVIGFSRGAVIAREFANKICAEGGTVDFLGIYDSVGSFGNPLNMTDKGYRKSIPSGVQRCAHALSIHEDRFTFRAIRANLAEGNTHTDLEEFWFPGVHSDVGGILKPGLGATALSWMYEQASQRNPQQWEQAAIETAKKHVDCSESPSKNAFHLPLSFLTKYRTRILQKDEKIYMSGVFKKPN